MDEKTNQVIDAPEQAAIPSDVPKLPLGIHELAKEMIASGYYGQTMEKDPEQAEQYILMAASNPKIEKELPPNGFSFWRAAVYQFRLWQARQGEPARAIEALKKGG